MWKLTTSIVGVCCLCVCVCHWSQSQISYHPLNMFQNCLKLDRCFGTTLNKMSSYCV